MTRKLKVTYSRSNECEVTGKVSSNDEHAVIELDGATVGDRIFPQSDIEWLKLRSYSKFISSSSHEGRGSENTFVLYEIPYEALR